MLSAPVQMGLDDCLEYIAEDELVEARVSHSNCMHGTSTPGQRSICCAHTPFAALTSVLHTEELNSNNCVQVTPTSVRVRKNPQMGKRGGKK